MPESPKTTAIFGDQVSLGHIIGRPNVKGRSMPLGLGRPLAAETAPQVLPLVWPRGSEERLDGRTLAEQTRCSLASTAVSLLTGLYHVHPSMLDSFVLLYIVTENS